MTTAVLEVEATPVPTAEIISGVSELETWAKSLTISTNDEYAKAAETIKGVKKWRGTIVDFFADSKAKAHSAWKAIVANEKSMTDRLDAVESQAKRAMITYQQEQERLRRQEEARLQAEADERARKERERLEREAAKLKTPEKREERLEMAAAVAAPVVHVAPTVQPVAGTSIRKIWKAEVTDLAAFFDHCLANKRYDLICYNERALDAYAKGAKEMAALPGVRFYAHESLAIGGR